MKKILEAFDENDEKNFPEDCFFNRTFNDYRTPLLERWPLAALKISCNSLGLLNVVRT